MEKPPIALLCLNDLTCRHCGEYVTCGPVYVLPNTSILCGRCSHLAKKVFRNYAFEVVASIFTYPCKNWENHCPAVLNFNDSLKHEIKCSYQGCISFFCAHPGACCKDRRRIRDGDVRLAPVPDYLLQNLSCTLCESYLSCDPIFIQSDGKNICHRCVRSNGEPPNCLRNDSYEKLSRLILFPCIYKNRGCPARLSFGREIWEHETTCIYGDVISKGTPEPSKKERGVIKTHTGHTYGTISPNSPLFAPPTDANQNVTKDIMKSIIKKQERRIKRVDEIGSEISRMNSIEGSNKNSSYSASSRSSTPPDNVDTKYSIEPDEEISINSATKLSRNSSMNNEFRKPTNYEVEMFKSNLYMNDEQSSERSYPRDSFDVDRTPSFHGGLGGNIGVGDKSLIKELKVRQNMIKRTHSLKQSIEREESLRREYQNMQLAGHQEVEQ